MMNWIDFQMWLFVKRFVHFFAVTHGSRDIHTAYTEQSNKAACRHWNSGHESHHGHVPA